MSKIVKIDKDVLTDIVHDLEKIENELDNIRSVSGEITGTIKAISVYFKIEMGDMTFDDVVKEAIDRLDR